MARPHSLKAAAAVAALTATVACGPPPSEGERLFTATCSPCHGPGGEGRPGQGPSLANSALLAGPADALVRLALDGIRNDDRPGQPRYQLPMPSWRVFTDAQLAIILSYARERWGNAPPIDAATIGAIRVATSGRTRPWSRAELDALAKGQQP